MASEQMFVLLGFFSVVSLTGVSNKTVVWFRPQEFDSVCQGWADTGTKNAKYFWGYLGGLESFIN